MSQAPAHQIEWWEPHLHLARSESADALTIQCSKERPDSIQYRMLLLSVRYVSTIRQLHESRRTCCQRNDPFGMPSRPVFILFSMNGENRTAHKCQVFVKTPQREFR